MRETIVLIHGSANGSYSWGPVERALEAAGAKVVAPDMLGYGSAPEPSAGWTIDQEVSHLEEALDGLEAIHLVAHSLGVMFALYLLRRLGARVVRLTLIDPVLVSLLRETGEGDGFAEMEGIYQRFMGLFPDHAPAARAFVEHWNGAGSWERIGDKARAIITRLISKVRLEVMAARADTTKLAEIVRTRPPTIILLGERTRIAPRAVARRLAEVFEAQTVIIPGAGHMVPLTHPEAVAHEILEFQSNHKKGG